MRVSMVRHLAVITWYCRYNYVHFKQNIFRGVLGSKQNCVEGTENSKCSLYIWKFSVHVLLKPGLKDFELYLASMWNERICAVVHLVSVHIFLIHSSIERQQCRFHVLALEAWSINHWTTRASFHSPHGAECQNHHLPEGQPRSERWWRAEPERTAVWTETRE